MNKPTKLMVCGLVCVALAAVLVTDHYILCGRFYDVADVQDHETVEAMLLSAGITFFLVGGLASDQCPLAEKCKEDNFG
jgi:hypothetical protein